MAIIVTTLDKNNDSIINTEVNKEDPIVALVEKEEKEEIKQPEVDSTKEENKEETSTDDEEKVKLKKEIEELKKLNKKEPEYKPVEQPKQQELGEEPDVDDFDTLADYNKAHAKWSLKKAKEDQDVEDYKLKVKEHSDNLINNHNKRVSDAMQKYPDWAEVTKQDLPLTMTMHETIVDSDISAELVYYFYKNPEEYKSILSKSPINQAKHVGKIEDKIKLTLDKTSNSNNNSNIQEKKISDAPAPVKPVSSSNTGKVGETDPNKMSYGEYKIWYEKTFNK